MKIIPGLLLAQLLCGTLSAQNFPSPGDFLGRKEEVPIRLPGSMVSSADSDEQETKKLLFRTLDEYTGKCGTVPQVYFKRLFGDGVTVSGALQPVSPEMIAEIAKRIRARVESGDITVKLSSTESGSASWGATIMGGVVSGDLSIKSGDVTSAIAGDRSRRGLDLLRKQEQLADSLLHETAHIYYSIFQHEFKGKASWMPERLTEVFSRDKFWDGTEPCMLMEGADCRRTKNVFKLSASGYSEGARPNEETARQVANGIYRCTNGAAVPRVLGLKVGSSY